MKTISKFILIVAVFFITLVSVNAQTETPQTVTLTAAQQWNVINSLKTVKERKEYRNGLTNKQKAELTIEQLNRELKSMTLTDEQRQALIEVIDSITIEFITEAPKDPDGEKSKNPVVTPVRQSIMKRLSKLFTQKQMYEILGLYGDRETLDDPTDPRGY